MLSLRDHFSTGILEATEVDPGQEYFFDLSRFHRNEVEAGARVEVGTRGFVDGSFGYNEVTFDDPQAGFFPYDARFARVGAGLTFGDNLRAGLYYGYDRIPSPDAPPARRCDRAFPGRDRGGRFRNAHDRPGHSRLHRPRLPRSRRGRAELSWLDRRASRSPASSRRARA